MQRRELGQKAEIYAAEYLQRQGYRIIERNWRGRFGEIDLVAHHLSTLVLIEVRARRGANFGTPEESITATKAERLRRLCYEYLASLATAWQGAYRIDIIAINVDRDGRPVRLNHLESAIGE